MIKQLFYFLGAFKIVAIKIVLSTPSAVENADGGLLKEATILNAPYFLGIIFLFQLYF